MSTHPAVASGRSVVRQLAGAGAAVAGGLRGTRAVFPRDFLPAPSGAFPLGTATWQVNDPTRTELFTTHPGQPRQLVAQAWYPAQVAAAGPVEPYCRDPRTFDTILSHAHAPTWLLSYLTRAPTHAITDAPAATGTFPVVFFATGNMGYRGSNTIQVEDLASHGFIVICFDQPGTIGTSLLADGTRIPYAGAAVVRPLVDASLTDPPPTIPTLQGTEHRDGIAAWLAADPATILDSLTHPTTPAQVRDHVDTSRVGAFGLSLGGITMAQWAATDPRVQALQILEAPMPRAVITCGLDIPTMWITRPATDMRAERWSETDIARHATQHQLYEQLLPHRPAHYVELPRYRHADLTDAPWGSPAWSLLGLTSPGTGHTTHDTLRHLTTDFFTHTLTTHQDTL